MKNGEIKISVEKYGYAIKVSGRANLECSPPLKSFADIYVNASSASRIIFDLTSCEWMDSTFMGVLAIIGLRARKSGISIEMHKADPKIVSLLRDLGINSLFKFVDNDTEISEVTEWKDIVEFQKSPIDKNKTSADTILKAHETLIEADKTNAQKFAGVVDLIKKDMTKTDNSK